MALADELADLGIERVVLEATSDYWRPFFYLLEARGLVVWLVNARDVKNVPGRPKTDKLDSIWLAKLNERGMLRPSFVPPKEIRELRDYTRLRSDLVRERTRHKQRVEKLLEDALVKLSSVATDIFGVSGRAMLAALIAGERDPDVLAELARQRLRAKIPALREALVGRFDDHHAELLAMLLRQVDTLSTDIDDLTERIDELVAKIPAAQAPADPETGELGSGALSALERLDEVPGIGPLAAQAIVAEVGLDMAQFPTPGHLVSWAKVAPRTIQSGPRTRGGATGKGNRYLKARPRGGRHCSREDRHVSRCPLPTARQAHRQAEGAGCDRALDPRHRLAPARRSERPLRRPRLGLLRAACRQGPSHPRSRPPADGARTPGQPQPRPPERRACGPSGAPPRTPVSCAQETRTTHAVFSVQVTSQRSRSVATDWYSRPIGRLSQYAANGARFPLPTITFLGEQPDITDPEAAVLVSGLRCGLSERRASKGVLWHCDRPSEARSLSC